MAQLYPDGYSSYAPRLTLAQVEAKHRPKMEHEFAERWFAAMAAADGLVGIGGGWRAVNPVAPGFAPPGRSFHESQQWRDGQYAYAAIDLIGVNARHGTAQEWMRRYGSQFGLLTFWNVMVGGHTEPWHVQADDIPRGYSQWTQLGRPNPFPAYILPGHYIPPVPTFPPAPITAPLEVGDMHMSEPERRLIDTRQSGNKQPTILLAVQTGLAGVAKAVDVTVTAIPQGISGYMSVNGQTSFNNFGQAEPSSFGRSFKVEPDGSILMGSSTPIHIVVDLVAEYH